MTIRRRFDVRASLNCRFSLDDRDASSVASSSAASAMRWKFLISGPRKMLRTTS